MGKIVIWGYLKTFRNDSKSPGPSQEFKVEKSEKVCKFIEVKLFLFKKSQKVGSGEWPLLKDYCRYCNGIIFPK